MDKYICQCMQKHGCCIFCSIHENEVPEWLKKESTHKHKYFQIGSYFSFCVRNAWFKQHYIKKYNISDKEYEQDFIVNI